MSCLYLKNLFKLKKTNNALNDYKWRKRRLKLSCCKKTTDTIKRNNVKNHINFYRLNCFLSFATKNKLESHEKTCKKKDFCRIILPTENNNTFEFNQYMKSGKMPHDAESLIKK